jgi:hypothetical protein
LNEEHPTEADQRTFILATDEAKEKGPEALKMGDFLQHEFVERASLAPFAIFTGMVMILHNVLSKYKNLLRGCPRCKHGELLRSVHNRLRISLKIQQ